MLGIVLMPDGLFTASALNYNAARIERAVLRRLGAESSTLTHGFFLDMHGFVLRSPKGELTVLNHTHLCKIADVGDMNSYWKEGEHTIHPRSDFPLDIDLAKACLQSEWIHELRQIPEEEINRLAKSDYFAKLFACTQALWLLTQVLSRAVQHLAVSLLELSTVSFVAFGVVGYALWWKKPQDCSGPIIIKCRTQEDYDIIRSVKAIAYQFENGLVKRVQTDHYVGVYNGGLAPDYSAIKAIFNPVWSEYMSDYIDSAVVGIVMFIACSAFLGSIHCIAWNFYFPTETERWIWRGCAIILIVWPPVWFLTLWLTCFGKNESFNRKVGERWHWWRAHPPKPGRYFVIIFCTTLFVTYILARMFLILEIFLALRAMPASTYAAINWSSFVPHV